MSANSRKVSQYWSHFSENNSSVDWRNAGPEIQRYENRTISGEPDVDWVEYTLNCFLAGRLPLNRCLSLGCGNGHLERRLANLRAFKHCDAYDIAEGSVHVARQLADEAGITGIQYHVADINKLDLPVNVYDVVWIGFSLHHFEALEHISRQIRQSLKPDGILVLNEYIGPDRFQFPARQKEIANLCLQLLPKAYRFKTYNSAQNGAQQNSSHKEKLEWLASRVVDKIRDGDLVGVIQRRLAAHISRLKNKVDIKVSIQFPTSRDVIAVDPSEAIRSSEILPVLQCDFDIVEKKDWGLNILQFLLDDIAGNFTRHEEGQLLLKMLTNIEATLLQCGEYESDFSYIVARPRRE